MNNDGPFLRVREVATVLGVVPSRVYQLISERELPSTRVGGAIRIPREAFERWLTMKTEAALAAVEQRDA